MEPLSTVLIGGIPKSRTNSSHKLWAPSISQLDQMLIHCFVKNIAINPSFLKRWQVKAQNVQDTVPIFVDIVPVLISVCWGNV
jgi:hypothetical protein